MKSQQQIAPVGDGTRLSSLESDSPLACLRVPQAELERAIFAIHSARKVAVLSHMNPDADAYASSIALTVGLRALGKEVSCFNTSEGGSNLRYLPLLGEVRSCRSVREAFDLVIVSDCSAISMLGNHGSRLVKMAPNVLNLDHHHLVNKNFGNINVVAGNVSSSSELVALVLRQLKAPISPELATLLLAGIYSDTLSLQKVPRDGETFQVVSDLIKAGGDLDLFSDQMFRSVPLAVLRLQAELIQRLEPKFGGRYAAIVVTDADVARHSVKEEDVVALRNFPLTIEGVRIGAFLQFKGDIAKVSLRSKPGYPVHEIALALGGAGHRNAAGFISKLAEPDLIEALEVKVAEVLQKGSE